jgi:cell division control protein 6
MFNIVNNESVFQNQNILSDLYIPENLQSILHRDNIIEQLVYSLRYTRFSDINSKNTTTILYGNAGTGKSLVINTIVKEYMENYPETISININCRATPAQSHILQDIKKQIEHRLNIESTTNPRKITILMNSIEELLKSSKGPLFLIFDEPDSIRSKNDLNKIIYFITKIDIKYGIKIILCINNPKSKFINIKRPDPRNNVVIFPPYDHLQLNAILKQRAKLAIKKNAIGPEVIETCSAYASRENGDARLAINILKHACFYANRRNSKIIEIDDVKNAYTSFNTSIISLSLQQLSTHQKILLIASVYALSKFPEPQQSTMVISTIYSDMCRYINIEPLSYRRISTFFSELASMNLIQIKTISKDIIGTTRKITWSINPTTLLYLKSDTEVSPLIDLDNFHAHYTIEPSTELSDEEQKILHEHIQKHIKENYPDFSEEDLE